MNTTDNSVGELIRQGLLAQESGQWQQALAFFELAAAVEPGRAPVWAMIGNVHSRQGDWNRAEPFYRRALAANARFADGWNNLGLALKELGREEEAIEAHRRAVECNPLHANALFNLGKLAAGRGEFTTALERFEEVLAIDPKHAYTHHELGSVLEQMGYLEHAVVSYRQSAALDPTFAVRKNLAAVLAFQGDPESLALHRQLAAERPGDPEPRWSLGMALLMHGQLAEGWRAFEARMEIPRFYNHHHRFEQPRWQGEPLGGRTVLLYGEQGHGDTLQFLRYIPQVQALGGRVVLDVPPLLKTLLAGFAGVAAVTGLSDPKPAFDCYASLMSLPHLLGMPEIPPPVRFEAAPRPRNEGARRRVGLSWAGNPKHQRDRLRSIPIEQWKMLLGVDGVDFVSLQMGPASEEAMAAASEFHFVESCADLPDFAAFARVLETLDLVITVDTATAHLAGTMGLPTWILLGQAVDWRWGLGTTQTPWYPSARLFRQSQSGDWSATMTAVRLALDAH